MGHWLASVCYPQKQGRHFHPSQLRCSQNKGCFLFSPSPFATQPATCSSECSLWPTVSYHHRKCPCRTGTDYGTEIWINIARWCDVAWRTRTYLRECDVIKTKKNSSPVRGKGKSRRSWDAVAHKPRGALCFLSVAPPHRASWDTRIF